ncbi:uncharacterized protein G2W53_015954 [Senna tora]|uniref:Uncharacterized protein n=1 Tax=Senna tora TaxID=362788 RepID=A0A835C6B3_9FABA|nr:uncharacterized protein G2W53_015954 [Senna tora]
MAKGKRRMVYNIKLKIEQGFISLTNSAMDSNRI